MELSKIINGNHDRLKRNFNKLVDKPMNMIKHRLYKNYSKINIKMNF